MSAITVLLEQGLVEALIASAGGCAMRQYSEHRSGIKSCWSYRIADMLIAVFLGYYAFRWMMQDFHISDVHASIVNIIIGYTGSKVVEIARDVYVSKFAGMAGGMGSDTGGRYDDAPAPDDEGEEYREQDDR